MSITWTIPSNLHLANEEDKNTLNYVVNRANSVLSGALFPHYTDHSIKHSNRVLFFASKLLGTTASLTEDEKFILLCAIVLHDIGMQTNGYLPGSSFPLNNEQLEAIRAEHHEFSYKYITDNYITLGLQNKQNFVHYIALVAKNHRATDLQGVSEKEPFGMGIIRIKLLSAIIRLADCLDCDSSRVNIHLLNNFEIEQKSKAYWFCHNYVQSICINEGKVKLVFAFPEEYNHKNICSSIKNFISEEIKCQMSELFDIFYTHNIFFHRSLVEVEERYHKGIQVMPYDVYTYIDNNFNKKGENGALNLNENASGGYSKTMSDFYSAHRWKYLTKDFFPGNLDAYRRIYNALYSDETSSLIPYVGSGFSVFHNGFDVWSDVLLKLCDNPNSKMKIRVIIEESYDLFAAYEYLETSMGKTAITDDLRKIYSLEKVKNIPDEQLKKQVVWMIPKLFGKVCLTSNLDTLLDQVYRQICCAPEILTPLSPSMSSG